MLPVERRSLVAAAEDLFTTTITLPVLAAAELYGSKLVAAFDRQHPRDWFDVLQLRRHDGLPLPVVDCFVAYLAGHNRPIHEVLFPRIKAMGPIYEAEFKGMTVQDIELAELESTRRATLADLPAMLTADQRQFLLSLARAEPQWQLMPFPHLSALPAIRWKLQNLEKLRTRNKRKFTDQHDQLAARLRAV